MTTFTAAPVVLDVNPAGHEITCHFCVARNRPVTHKLFSVDPNRRAVIGLCDSCADNLFTVLASTRSTC